MMQTRLEPVVTGKSGYVWLAFLLAGAKGADAANVVHLVWTKSFDMFEIKSCLIL